ncbi:MAG: hypothetical protein AAGC91_13555, partial [Pseudomonadota bacterium]
MKRSVFGLAVLGESHLYAVKTLHRPIIEHYLKFLFVLFRFRENRDDYHGLEYITYSRVSE